MQSPDLKFQVRRYLSFFAIIATILAIVTISVLIASLSAGSGTKPQIPSDALLGAWQATDKEGQCEHILSGEPIDYPVPLPITCESPISPAGDPFQFAFDANGGLTVYHGKTVVCQLTDDDTDILDVNNASPFITEGVFKLQDVTYDGYKDIAIQSSQGAYNWTFDYYAYDPVKKSFDCGAPLLEAVNPTVDTRDQTITSNDLGRGLGDMYLINTYAFEHGAYVKVADESQDIVSDQDASPVEYEHIAHELKNGAWATTTDEILSETDLENRKDAPSLQRREIHGSIRYYLE